MEGLLSVSIGTVVWASIAFLLVIGILAKAAWKPIIKSLNEREEGIAQALGEARKAREEMTLLQAGNEQLLREARDERDQILKDARAMAEKLRADLNAKAQAEYDRKITSALVEIDNQKKAAIAELKNNVATLSIEIAEKLVKEKLSDPEKQKVLNESLLAEISPN
ncbi:MAG: F0F1 ATP synthase subunit B [Crocinitomicaceae bacterium]|nr:F0F1 ATP synthase subunit B [Crocinitomicaceae bacterium]